MKRGHADGEKSLREGARGRKGGFAGAGPLRRWRVSHFIMFLSSLGGNGSGELGRSRR